MDHQKAAKFFIGVGRLFATFAFLALIGAWITEATGEPLMGMSQEHLFNDTISLALLGISGFLCGFSHMKGL